VTRPLAETAGADQTRGADPTAVAPLALSAARDRVIAVLRRRRQVLRLSQRALSAQIGSHGSIADWETGRATPRLGNLLRWAHALDCTIVIVAPDPPVVPFRRRPSTMASKRATPMAGTPTRPPPGAA
jgi:hypothetical protein